MYREKFIGAVIMRVEIFQTIPQQAVEIRQKVFIDEQGCPHIWRERCCNFQFNKALDNFRNGKGF